MSYFLKKNKKNRGFMLVEVIVVISIITVSVLVAMSVAQKSIYVSRQALHTIQASFLLEEGAEIMHILRDNTWDNISGLNDSTDYYPVFSSGTWSLSTAFSQVGIFSRIVTITSVNRDPTTADIISVGSGGSNDPGTKLVTITVSWPEGGDTITKTLQFYIMDIFS